MHTHYRAQGLDWASRIGHAVSEDGVHWHRLRRPVLAPVDGSDSRGVEDPRVTFLRKIGDRYAVLHRRWPNVWIAYSDDLVTWHEEDHAIGLATCALEIWYNLL